MSNQSARAVPGAVSANLKKALIWTAETLQDHPEKNRLAVLQEAQLRFDLTPLECEFLSRNSGMPENACDDKNG